jgi:hypothetical protein
MARKTNRSLRWLVPVTLVSSLLGLAPDLAAHAAAVPSAVALRPHTSKAVAFDVSRPLRDIAREPAVPTGPVEVSPDRGSIATEGAFTGDRSVQIAVSSQTAPLATDANFEGLANSDNPRQVSPPDPVGDVGPSQYVEMVNLVFAVFSKTGTRLLGPTPLGALWDGFAVNDCTDLSGDPIVRHDQLADRWILTQFTTRGPTFFNCIAVSQTADATGAYFRYAFSTGTNFPDYPKYGVWPNAYFIATREFQGLAGPFVGIGAYALERERMLDGDPNARVVSFLRTPADTPLSQLGDGWLPSDLDGQRLPPAGSPTFFVGTMDDGAGRGAPFDGVNIFQFSIAWNDTPIASFGLVAQLQVEDFDSLFPCSPGPRNCIPQPDTANKIDVLSYRQRPTWRLAYRNFGTFETLVTNQSVQARPGIAGVRWYEIQRVAGQFSVHQQSTFAPDDGVNRWMGSVAMDRLGDMALGYSVSNATDVFPGIRFTGRLSRDPLDEMTLGEGVVINGSGSQLGPSPRWGDYTSMNVDPTDDCTFWYVNEYYQVSTARGWQTRIGSFRLPGC